GIVLEVGGDDQPRRREQGQGQNDLDPELHGRLLRRWDLSFRAPTNQFSGVGGRYSASAGRSRHICGSDAARASSTVTTTARRPLICPALHSPSPTSAQNHTSNGSNRRNSSICRKPAGPRAGLVTSAASDVSTRTAWRRATRNRRSTIRGNSTHEAKTVTPH